MADRPGRSLHDPCVGRATRRRVVIAGGGYAGTTCAVRLGREVRGSDDIDIVMVEPNPCQEALSELDLVAVGPTRPGFCELWHPTVFRDLPVTVCYNRVSSIGPERHSVIVGGGEEVDYWRLVIATGAIPSVPPIPGLREKGMTMWSVEDAQELQERIQGTFKEAAKIADREERRRRLTFTVVGGGATGVEIVGTMAEMLPRRARDAGLNPDEIGVHLVEARPDILYDLTEDQRERTARRLEQIGAEVITGEKLVDVSDNTATLESGREVPSSVLVWTGGARADPHAMEWGLASDDSGRLVVDEYLKAPGHDDIYVIGDVASAKDPRTGRTLPMLAQVAIQEGPHAADSILREARGERPEPYRPHLRGEFVSVGPRWGIGWMYGLKLSGILGITMKRITYVKYWLQVGGISLAWKRTREMLSMGR